VIRLSSCSPRIDHMGLLSNPQDINFDDRCSQNNSAALVPYSALEINTYSTVLPRFTVTCGVYAVRDIWTSSSAIVPSNRMWTTSSFSTYIKAPGTSTVATSRFSMASMTSSFDVCKHGFRPSAHPRPLMTPVRLSLRNMRYTRAAFFLPE
jgi:hypothetical protein